MKHFETEDEEYDSLEEYESGICKHMAKKYKEGD